MVQCANCGRPHSLFWKVGLHGRRVLRYRCDQIEKLRRSGLEGGFTVRIKRVTAECPADVSVHDWNLCVKANLPEEWDRQKRKLELEKKQMRLL